MGLLTEGKPLKWHESKEYIDYVKKHGVEQFINLYNSEKGRCCDSFKWGDELEYLLIYAPSNSKEAKLCLRSAEILSEVNKKLNENKFETMVSDSMDKIILHPEYGSFMIEATPFIPYGDSGCDLLLVERNMYQRRKLIESVLQPDEYLSTLSAYPMMGVGNNFIHNNNKWNTKGPIASSQFIPDILINPHPRFGALTRNIRLRRGKPVSIHVPIYRDINTPLSENSIFMDAMVFGMGNCCVQCTYQARSINEARHLYDQLAVLTPIMMALSASTPFLKGKISDFDCRWTVISQSVDDRTNIEISNNLPAKSRYDTINNYLSKSNWLGNNENIYNDIDIQYDKYTYNRLKKEGIDDLLCKHIGHLFIRDPLVILDDLIKLNDKETSHHFETIQSTNWQNVRFKPPPVGSNIGWRVEFRSLEIQFTEFENAALVVFVTLASRAILYYGLNFYIPISKNDENFHLAHKRDAINREKFWWRTCSSSNSKLNMKLLTISEILLGTNECRGLVSIIHSYLKVIGCTGQTLNVVNKYLLFIQNRANGTYWTNAKWLRNFVKMHKKYKRDSNINMEICRDIIDTQQKLINGDIHDNKLYGDVNNINMKTRYYKTMPFNYVCNPSTSPKLLSKL